MAKITLYTIEVKENTMGTQSYLKVFQVNIDSVIPARNGVFQKPQNVSMSKLPKNVSELAKNLIF